jgi:hypothetical protein
MENSVLLLYYNNTNHANVGDATGLRGSSTAGSFYVSLHTSDPGETGNQSTNETAYTNYARVAVARSSGGWTVTADTVVNAGAVTFPACGASGATITHFGVGTASSGAGVLLFSGSLSASLAVSSGITPAFSAGQLSNVAA